MKELITNIQKNANQCLETYDFITLKEFSSLDLILHNRTGLIKEKYKFCAYDFSVN